MSNCDQNCESVANLNDYAANLIEYSKLINAWLNGPQDGMVNVGGVPTPTLRNLVMALKFLSIDPFVQNGGGIGIDADGKMYVDFSLMPTDKFEALLRQIRVPIWLSGNTNFYVDKAHANASDTIDDGRGLSMDKPFKSIQPCVDYVINNYNMVNFSAYINIAPGIYSENLILGKFSRTSGAVFLRPYPDSSGNPVIKMTNTVGVKCVGGPYYLYGLDISMKPIYVSPLWTYIRAISVEEEGILNLLSCNVDMSDLSGITPSSDVTLQMITASAGGSIILNASDINYQRKMSLKYAKFEDKPSYALYGERSGLLQVLGTNLNNPGFAQIECEGTCTSFLRLYNNSSFIRLGGKINNLIFIVPTGKISIGKKYIIDTGSSCETLNGGADYFPGDQAGEVQSSTYSWYLG